MKKERTEEKKKLNKKAVILYSITGSVTIAIAVVAGVLVGQNVFKQKMDYSQFDTGEIEIDYSSKYEEFKTTSEDKYFTKFTPTELANIALLKLGDVEHFYSTKSGKVLHPLDRTD